jgi:hypothetical protein
MLRANRTSVTAFTLALSQREREWGEGVHSGWGKGLGALGVLGGILDGPDFSL